MRNKRWCHLSMSQQPHILLWFPVLWRKKTQIPVCTCCKSAARVVICTTFWLFASLAFFVCIALKTGNLNIQYMHLFNVLPAGGKPEGRPSRLREPGPDLTQQVQRRSQEGNQTVGSLSRRKKVQLTEICSFPNALIFRLRPRTRTFASTAVQEPPPSPRPPRCDQQIGSHDHRLVPPAAGSASAA